MNGWQGDGRKGERGGREGVRGRNEEKERKGEGASEKSISLKMK